MNSLKKEVKRNDERLAELLNRIDDSSVDRNLEEEEIREINETIGSLLIGCSRGAKDGLREYIEYVPKELRERYNLN